MQAALVPAKLGQAWRLRTRSQPSRVASEAAGSVAAAAAAAAASTRSPTPTSAARDPKSTAPLPLLLVLGPSVALHSHLPLLCLRQPRFHSTEPTSAAQHPMCTAKAAHIQPAAHIHLPARWAHWCDSMQRAHRLAVLVRPAVQYLQAAKRMHPRLRTARNSRHPQQQVWPAAAVRSHLHAVRWMPQTQPQPVLRRTPSAAPGAACVASCTRLCGARAAA